MNTIRAIGCRHSHEKLWEWIWKWENPNSVYEKVLGCLNGCPLRPWNLCCAHKIGTVSYWFVKNRINKCADEKEKEIFKWRLLVLDYIKLYIDQSYRFFYGGNLNDHAFGSDFEPNLEEVIFKENILPNSLWWDLLKNLKYKRDKKEYDDSYEDLLKTIENLVVKEYNQILHELKIIGN